MDEWGNVMGPPIWFLIFFVTFCIFIYNWRRRHFYYHASKIPGPFSLPLLGSIGALYAMRKNFFEEAMKMMEKNPPVFKLWIGTKLHICLSRPEDLEIILNTCLERSFFYQLVNEHTPNSLLTAPVSVWKKHRQIINHSFNPKIINSFFDVFLKNGKKLVEALSEVCGREESDLTSKMWRCTLDMTHETIADVDPTFQSDFQKASFCQNTESLEKMAMGRFWNVFYHLDSLWKISSARKKGKCISENIYRDVSQMIDYKLKETSKVVVDNEDTKSKRMLNYLLHPKNRDKMERRDLESEVFIMCVASSETSAIVMTSAIVALGICQDIQDKLFQEISRILPNGSSEMTLDKLKEMNYLDRVIKETMRMFSVFPVIIRYLEKDIQSGSYVFPAGSDVIIPIAHIHRDPNLYPDPLKFDPDRFLPEEVAKRHRCAYIPFSFGPRNCIGFKYGMLSMKVMLAEIVRNFKIKTLKYKSVEELEVDFHMMAKLKNYSVVLEKRS